MLLPGIMTINLSVVVKALGLASVSMLAQVKQEAALLYSRHVNVGMNVLGRISPNRYNHLLKVVGSLLKSIFHNVSNDV